MIISHKHKFIFIKTKKTAGTSLEFALRTICGEKDVISRTNPKGEEERKLYNIPPPRNNKKKYKDYTKSDWKELFTTFKPKLLHQHLSALEIKSLVREEEWNSYYKFCFERNPFDKVISHYYWIQANYNVRYNSIMEFLKSTEFIRMKGYEMYSINKLVAVDKIYKYEEMDAALLDISNRLHLENRIELPRLEAKSNTRLDKRHYSEVLTIEEKELIEVLFAREIRLMDYTF